MTDDDGAVLPLVVVVVGTDHHPFDRVVGWADSWAARHGSVARTLIQYGTSRPPTHATGRRLVGREEIQRYFAEARSVVTHGGPSTIIEACRHGHVPIVVPRSPALGEHVDGHQERFTALMAERSLIRLVTSSGELARLLDGDLADGPPLATADLPDPEDATRRVAALVDEVTRSRAGRRRR